MNTLCIHFTCFKARCSFYSNVTFSSDNPTNLFGKKLHDQVDDRLKFYETGEAPIKNEDAMQEVLEELKQLTEDTESSTKKKKKKKKKIKEENEENDEEVHVNGDDTKEVIFPFL